MGLLATANTANVGWSVLPLDPCNFIKSYKYFVGTQDNVLQTLESFVEPPCFPASRKAQREGEAPAVGILLLSSHLTSTFQDCKIAIVHGWLNPNPFSHCLGSRVEGREVK